MIVVGGENLIDYVQTGTENGLPVYTAIPGGSCYNCAMAAARQGVEVAYVTPISNDSLGNLLADRLLADGVNLATPRVAAPTSLAVVSVNNSIPSYQFYRDGTAERLITMDGLLSALPQDARIFHVGSLALIEGQDAQVWQDFFRHCRKNGILTSLDPNARPIVVKDRAPYIARLEQMIAEADILKLSDEDLEYMFPDLTQSEGMARIVETTSAGLIVLTQGAQGASVFHAETHFTVPSAKADPLIDTVGAGDTFMGTLLCELHKLGVRTAGQIAGQPRETIAALVTKAAQAAAKNCEHAGCNPPYTADL